MGDHDTRVPSRNIGPFIGAAGSILGSLIGLIQIIAGGSFPWVSGHQTILGMISLGLSLTALYSSFRWKYPSKKQGMFPIFLGLLGPAVIGFATTGLLWFIPGPILLTASSLMARKIIEKRKNKDEIRPRSYPEGAFKYLMVAGLVLISIPLVLGPVFEPANLVHVEIEDSEHGTRPLDIAWSENGQDDEHLPGILGIHLILLSSTVGMILSWILGNRTAGIAISVSLIVLLLFFFLVIPNILFVTGVDIKQFSTDHFRSISLGMYSAFMGAMIILGSLLYQGRKEK